MSTERHRPTLGVLVDRLEDEYQNHLFAGIERAARAHDVSLICLCGGILGAPYQSGRERNFSFDVVNREVLDGLIVMSGSIANHLGPSALQAYCERFAPAPICSIGVRLSGMPNVLIDNASGLESAISAWIDRGRRRRIAFIRGPAQNEEAEIRYDAYRRVLARHGLPLDPSLVTTGDFQKASGARAVATLLDERSVDIDAIVAASDYMALGALEALLVRAVRVPQDVAVSGFDDVEDARFAPVPLSTVRQPLAEQGQRALELVLEEIRTGCRGCDVVLPTRVVVRASCGLGTFPAGTRAAGVTPGYESESGAEYRTECGAEYAQAQLRLQQARQLRALRRSGEALSRALSEHEALEALSGELEGLGMQRAVVCLYDPAAPAPQSVRRFRIEPADAPAPAWVEDSTSVERVLEREPWQPAGRYSAVAEPLFSTAGPIGVGVFQVGPLSGSVYEFLREQLSAALWTATLVKRVVNETARREAAEREQNAREIELANQIQTGILPRTLHAPGLELEAGMLPAAQVGGDYYDVLPCEGGAWLGIGDVAGHGLSTGLVMLMIQSVIAALCARSPGAAPSELLAVLNRVIYENVRDRLERDEHATLALIRYTDDGRLVIAGGHEDIVVCRARSGTCELIRTPGPWIGAFRDVDDSNVDSVHWLARGDIVLLYTDGVTEAADANGNQFGLERLCAELTRVRTEPVRAIHEHLMRRVLGWQLSQTDDITLLVARYVGN